MVVRTDGGDAELNPGGPSGQREALGMHNQTEPAFMTVGTGIPNLGDLRAESGINHYMTTRHGPVKRRARA